MAKTYLPERGDIIFTNFDPSAGHEQAHKRPALVLSPKLFNDKVELALVAPITSTIRGHGFEVKLDTSTKTQGVILCQQVKTIDFKWRGAELIEKVPKRILEDCLARVRVLVS